VPLSITIRRIWAFHCHWIQASFFSADFVP
jgi:hypothetical protein